MRLVPAPTIVVPAYGQLDLLAQCLRAIDEHTFVSVPVLVIDDCGPEPVDATAVQAALPSGRRYTLVRHEQNQGFVATMNDAFARCAGSDVVLVNSDVTVLPGWADRGGVLSVPELWPLRGEPPAALRERLERARRVTPPGVEIPVAVGHCTYFAGRALDAVGGFDLAFSPGYGEEVDWSLRARRIGWRHVAALHSFVWHEDGASFGAGPARTRLRRRHEVRILARHPRSFVKLRAFARDDTSPLAIKLAALARVLGVAERPTEVR